MNRYLKSIEERIENERSEIDIHIQAILKLENYVSSNLKASEILLTLDNKWLRAVKVFGEMCDRL